MQNCVFLFINFVFFFHILFYFTRKLEDFSFAYIAPPHRLPLSIFIYTMYLHCTSSRFKIRRAMRYRPCAILKFYSFKRVWEILSFLFLTLFFRHVLFIFLIFYFFFSMFFFSFLFSFYFFFFLPHSFCTVAPMQIYRELYDRQETAVHTREIARMKELVLLVKFCLYINSQLAVHFPLCSSVILLIIPFIYI